NPRNFRNPVLDDILTSVVGPLSNLAVATSATTVLIIIKLTSATGRQVIDQIVGPIPLHSQSILVPVCVLFYELLVINIVLAVFNLIPVPPLDGSHVLRHFLPEPVRRAYDTIGWLGLMALVYLGGGLLSSLIRPVLNIYRSILMSV